MSVLTPHCALTFCCALLLPTPWALCGSGAALGFLEVSVPTASLLRDSTWAWSLPGIALSSCVRTVMAMSTSGQLVEFLKKVEVKGPLSCDTVLKIFYQTCRAVLHMHKQKPPIIHRDLKVVHCFLPPALPHSLSFQPRGLGPLRLSLCLFFLIVS